MAARFVYWMNVSVDLFIEHDAGENGGGNWASIDEPLHQVFNDRASELSMMVQGRVMHELMEGYWPAMRHDRSEPAVMREYGEIWTTKPKVLVSTTRTSAEHNTTIVGQDVLTTLAELRAAGSGAIGVGGATLATSLVNAGLLDELLLFVHPVLLGTGRGLFDHLDAPLRLHLLEQETYGNGVRMQRFAIR